MRPSREALVAPYKMLDPIHSLAFSMQANRGVYAVLLGSGLSSAAGIPTGWQITLDLVGKLAALLGEAAEPDPEAWYRTRFGSDPDYSGLLDHLAKTSSERQQLLRPYWEPTDAERDEGKKEPTAAHHAVAALASRGFVRVIVTTNFDRLMERALSAAGIEPTVLSSPDQIIGAPPLIHMPCCVLKVHGDYLDTRIRNTSAELAQYPPQVDHLLDRIFDEFGLVVCGWSADWDPALRSALERASSRRYTAYWTARGTPSDVAQRLIAHRNAELISIADADAFFTNLNDYIVAIEEFSKPHPLSVEVAVTSLKRYLSESRFRIQFSDLVDESIQQLVATTSSSSFPPAPGSKPTPESVTACVRAYDAACSKLVALAVVGGAWAEVEHYGVWCRALERLGSPGPVPGGSGYTVWRELQRYPATLLLYALGLGAVHANRFGFLAALLAVKVRGEHADDLPAAHALPPSDVFSNGQEVMQVLPDMDRHRTPFSEWIFAILREPARRLTYDDAQFLRSFDKLEILIALGAGRPSAWGNGHYAPVGCFSWRGDTRNRFLAEIRDSLASHGEASPFVRSGVFGKSAGECQQAVQGLASYLSNLGWDLGLRFRAQ